MLGIKLIILARHHMITDGIPDPLHRHMEKARMAIELKKHTLHKLD